MIEPTRQVLENPLGLLGGRVIPGLTQYLLDPGVQRRVEPLDDIAPLVHLAALDEREAIAHRPAQRLGAIDDVRRAMSGCSPRSTKSASSALTTAAFSVAPTANASTCFSPAPSMPIATTRT